MIEAWAKFPLLKSPDRTGDGSEKGKASRKRRKGSPPEGETKEQKRERLKAKRLRNAAIRAKETAERVAKEEEERKKKLANQPRQIALGPAATAAQSLEDLNREIAAWGKRRKEKDDTDEPPLTSAGDREPAGPRRGGPHNKPQSPRQAENPLPTGNDDKK